MHEVTAITRDGIEVSCDLYIDFQIRRDPPKSKPEIPYTFDEKAVFQAIYSKAVREEQWQPQDGESKEQAKNYLKSEYRWMDAVSNEGAEELRNLIAQYTLDQLYATGEPDREPRIEIEQNLLSLLQGRMRTKGVDVLHITLGVFAIPHPVVAQRVETWKTNWERRQKAIWTQGESELQRRTEIARALAQLEMIENITKALPVGDDAVSKDIVTLRLIQAIEAMARQSAEREEVTAPQSRRVLHLLRQLLAEVGATQKSGRND